MNHRTLSWALAVAPLLATCAVGQQVAETSARPNIVILYADDLGYGDLSSYGAPEIRTPAIDSIGRDGVRFTRFYANAPECSPSRVALLTGRYQQHVGGLECAIGVGNAGRYDEAEWLQRRGELGLPVDETTIAARLRDVGYDTAIVGKWHLGYEPKFNPKHHGFAESFVALGGELDYVSHRERNGDHQLTRNGEPVTANGYLTDVLTDHALEWVARPRKGPYFLYLPYTAPHSPYQAPGDGALDANSPLWNQSKGPRETYRAMIEHLDRRVGDILQAIARSPAANNTIVVFLSDNGGTGSGSNQPFRGYKGRLFEGGIRVPCLLKWPARIPAGIKSDQVALNFDLTATLLAAAVAREVAARPLEGIDLLPILTGERSAPARTLFWRYKRHKERRWAVMDGDLKYIHDNGERMLFDLAADPAEANNLIESRAADAEALAAKIAPWEAAVEAPRLREFFLQAEPKAIR